MVKCAYSIHRMYYLGGEIHPNINRMVLLRLVSQSNAIFETIYIFDSLAYTPSPYVTLLHLFGQPPPPRRVTYFLNDPYPTHYDVSIEMTRSSSRNCLSQKIMLKQRSNK